jgi:hypothetical protein
MSPREVAERARHQAVKTAWRRRQVRPGAVDPLAVPTTVPAFASLLSSAGPLVPDPAAVDELVVAAEEIMAGRATILGVERSDFEAPDWWVDPVTGVRAPDGVYAFSIDHRSPAEVGVIKNVWEPSRHHQLTILAAAYRLTGDDRFAERTAALLRGWWATNPFLSGVHWTSGIELGIRLISWVWVRRLLDGWPNASGLFEHDTHALQQIHHHQDYLVHLLSSGSSANNHVIAEAAGLAVAALAFPWFDESDRWRRKGLDVVVRQLERQTDADGLNRELASEYHGLVLELGLAVAAELELAGHPVPDALSAVLVRMFDALAAVVDAHLEPPRQGDGDGGSGWLFDAPSRNRWATLLVVGAEVTGPLPWWPRRPAPGVGASLLAAALPAALTSDRPRPASRPSFFAEAGMTLLRGTAGDREVWCRLDAGPHGYLSIAAHAHADALAVELRVDGVDLLADPGTYCYTGDDEARRYFRSTVGHNTLELGGRDQSLSGGPFMWTRHAQTELISLADDGELAVWTAEHDGYGDLNPSTLHRRTVRLSRPDASLEVVDELTTAGPVPARLAWHIGPLVEVELEGSTARCRWAGGAATLHLPPELAWRARRGEVAPTLGWYSPGFGVRVPATTLVGTGTARAGTSWTTVLAIAR